MNSTRKLSQAKQVSSMHNTSSAAYHKKVDSQLASIDAEIAAFKAAIHHNATETEAAKNLAHIEQLNAERMRIVTDLNRTHKNHQKTQAEDLAKIHQVEAAIKANTTHASNNATETTTLLQVNKLIALHRKQSEAEHQAIDKRLALIQQEQDALEKRLAQSTSQTSIMLKKTFRARLHDLQIQKANALSEIQPIHRRHEEIQAADRKAMAIAKAAAALQINQAAVLESTPVTHAPIISPFLDAAIATPSLHQLPAVIDNNEMPSISMLSGNALAAFAFVAMMYRHVKVVKVVTDSLVNTTIGFGNTVHGLFKQAAAMMPVIPASKADQKNRPRV